MCSKKLEELGIYKDGVFNKKAFYKYARENHPDKTKDELKIEELMMVNGCKTDIVDSNLCKTCKIREAPPPSYEDAQPWGPQTGHEENVFVSEAKKNMQDLHEQEAHHRHVAEARKNIQDLHEQEAHHRHVTEARKNIQNLHEQEEALKTLRCPEGKVLNPHTRKCIKIGGPTYRKLFGRSSEASSCSVEKPCEKLKPRPTCEKVEAKPVCPISPKPKSRRDHVIRKCPKGKVANPETERCIKVGGAVWKRIFGKKECCPTSPKPACAKPSCAKPACAKPACASKPSCVSRSSCVSECDEDKSEVNVFGEKDLWKVEAKFVSEGFDFRKDIKFPYIEKFGKGRHISNKSKTRDSIIAVYHVKEADFKEFQKAAREQAKSMGDGYVQFSRKKL